MVSTFGNEETVVIGQTPSTNPGSSPYGSSPNTPPPTWQASPYAVAQAQPRKRKSRAWLWILLSFFAICVIGVVGFAGFLVYLGIKLDEEAKNKNRALAANAANAANRAKANVNANSKANTLSSGDTKKDDFSTWNTGNFNYGKLEYKDNNLVVTSRPDHYTVVSTGKSFLTNDAISRVTVKNISNGNSTQGFGLVVNASPAGPLLKDYAFLIRTGDHPGYRIVRHLVSKESDLVSWTPNSAIDTGDDDNQLEVRDEGSKLSFYINDEFITSINDEYGGAASIGGIYAADSIPVAFSDLELEKK
jgi:nitrate reductase NapE component